MPRDDLIARLKRAEATLRRAGVAHLSLFGSYARGEAREGSDVDVFVDLEPGSGFLPFMEAYEIIADTVGLPVDYGTRSGLHPALRPQIEREAVRVF
ncbi:nucleotidyltransferase family protein [uncultured Methylobacterium sp.]|jgi:predicted nucleotidyltransferase|uniref:nucleotidyltransferase family protein n=1 Tax=uncultured Methylobacterium sp. TaxID=157278 RepID=UPI00261E424A|nr:nucleotidyltransferase family protein [uncultured Methylobacterium sp.]